MRPVTSRYRQDPQGIRQYGLIAEEVANTHELLPMLLNELQRQQRELGEPRVQNERLRATLVEQTAALATLEAAIHAAPLASR